MFCGVGVGIYVYLPVYTDKHIIDKHSNIRYNTYIYGYGGMTSMGNQISVVAASVKLRVGVQTVLDWRKSGKLTGTRPGKSWFIDEDSVNRLLGGATVPTSQIDVPVNLGVPVSQVADPPTDERLRESQIETELLKLEADKAEAKKRKREADAGSEAEKTEWLDGREKVLDEHEQFLDEKATRLEQLEADLKRRTDELVAASQGEDKAIVEAKAELELRKQDSEIALAEAQRIFTTEADVKRDELAKLEADIEASKDKIVKDAEARAKAIVKEATTQADNLARSAKVEGAKLDEKKVELDKGLLKLTADTAVVQRCMSRLERDVTALILYPPKEWPGKMKELIDFVKGELK